MERYCNYVLSIWNDVLKFVTGKIVNKMANDGMEEVRVSALAYMLRYDKRTLDKRGRRIRNIDFLTALRKSNAKYARMEVTHFSNTVNDGILYARKAEDFAKVFRDSFGIDCEAGDLFGTRKVRGDEYKAVKLKGKKV